MKQTAFTRFASMLPGERLNIAASVKVADWIEFGKAWIDEGHLDYEFNPDYTVFRRMTGIDGFSWPN